MIRLGLAPADAHLLTTSGRRTGRPHTTPVNLIEFAGRRWLVAPYGIRDWVRNVRADGRASITRGAATREVAVREVSPSEAAPVLKEYLRKVPIVAPYFEARRDSPVEEYIAEAANHPVFSIEGS